MIDIIGYLAGILTVGSYIPRVPKELAHEEDQGFIKDNRYPVDRDSYNMDALWISDSFVADDNYEFDT